MTPSAGQVLAALFGAFRLYRFDAGGFRFFETTEQAFWQSFFCALLILPLYLPLIMLRMDAVELSAPLYRIVLIEGIAYAIGWLAFPLALFYLTQALDRASRFFGYIVAYNWCAAPQVALMLGVGALRESGLMPQPTQIGLQLGAMLYVMGVQWFVARKALDIGPAAAIVVVAIDFIISFVIATVALAMLARGAA